jgi:autotransporter-associated beta strand protein
MNSTISTTATLRGNITASTLTKFGSGTIVLDATGGTYSGLSGAQVFVNAGNLVFGNDLLAGTNANLLPTDLRVVLRSFANFSVKDNQTLASLTGGGSAIVGSALAGDTARTLTVNNQADETFVGFLGSTSSASSGVNTSLAKGGAGQWRLTGFTAIGRVLDVRAGELVLGGTTGMGTGVADEQKIIVGPGATLTVDNTEANLADRIGANITTAAKGSQLALNGGRLRLLGHGDVPTSEEFGAAGGQAPNFGAGASTVEIIAGTAQPAVLISALPFTRSPGASALVRGSDLGNTQGNAGVGSLLFRAAPALTGFNSGAGSAGTPQVGILPGVTGASIIAGVDTFGLTTYDRGTTSDYGDYDDKGVRRLAVAELATTITSGDTTTLNNVLRTGGTASITAATAVNALHLSTGAVVSMSGAGTLAINSGTLLSANNGGAGTNSITGGSLTFGSGNEAMVYTASDLTIGSGLAGTLALTKGGPALLTLQGTNSFTGALTVNGGLLAVDSSARLGNAANALTLNNGGGIRATATFTLGRNTTLGASGGAVDVPTAVKLTLSGPIVGGLGTVTGGVGDANGLRADTAVVLHKTGLGELLLTGSETYTGVTSVDAGTLSVGDGVSGSLSGKTVVQNGGTLSGFGSIGAAEILNGGTLAPGGAPGRLTENGNLSFASGARLSLEINGTVAGTGYDQVALNGTLTLGPTSVLAGSSTGGFPNSTLFFPIDNDGSDPIVGTFNGLAQNSTFVLGSQAFRISYTGDSATNAFAGAGNDLAVMAVPEPASMTLLAAGVGALVFWRRARRSFPQK